MVQGFKIIYLVPCAFNSSVILRLAEESLFAMAYPL